MIVPDQPSPCWRRKALLAVAVLQTLAFLAPTAQAATEYKDSEPPAVRVWAVAPAPTGTRCVVFLDRGSEGGSGRESLSVVDLATGEEVKVDFGSLPLSREASWSPDASRFVTAVGVVPERIALVDARTGDWKLIPPQGPADEPLNYSPRWSPDGSLVLFEAFVEDVEGYRVCSYNLGTGQIDVLAVGEIRKVGNPFWGDSFVFGRYASANPIRKRYYCRTLQHLDRFKPGYQKELFADLFVERLSVSPSGTGVAALCLPEDVKAPSKHDGDHTLHLAVSPVEPVERRITSATFSGQAAPQWSPGGDQLLVSLKGSGVALVDVGNEQLTVLSDSAGLPLRGWSARWRGDGEAILYVRETGSRSAEALCFRLADRVVTKVFPRSP
jgi:hypothetical protein